MLFGRAFGQSLQYWLNLQSAYYLKHAEAAIDEQLLAVAELAESYFIEQSSKQAAGAGILFINGGFHYAR